MKNDSLDRDDAIAVVKRRVYAEADKSNYVTMSRTQSGQFIDNLLSMKEIGGVLENFKAKNKVRTYIKDSILNPYKKDLRSKAEPKNKAKIIKKLFGLSVIEIEKMQKDRSQVILYKSEDNGKRVVVCSGTYLKWETALRNGLSYIQNKPFSNGDKDTHILLLLHCQGKITAADKTHLRKSIVRCGADAHFYGEN